MHPSGGFDETRINIVRVGATVTDHIVANWPDWQSGIPAVPAN